MATTGQHSDCQNARPWWIASHLSPGCVKTELLSGFTVNICAVSEKSPIFHFED